MTAAGWRRDMAPIHLLVFPRPSTHDTIRLLLVLDARYTLADKEGCTPLHWAAMRSSP